MHKRKNFVDNFWKNADRVSIILGIVSFFGISFATVYAWFQVIPDIRRTKYTVEMIQDKFSSNEADTILHSYFFEIEQGNLEKAYNYFTEQKKVANPFEGFRTWLSEFVAFEGLNIIEIKEKRSASKKVFLAEFNFKKKGFNAVKSIWGIYLIYIDDQWKIDYTNVLFENGYKKGACDFYKFPDYCK